MSSGIKGFVAGVVLMVAAFLAFQQVVIRTSADDLDYRYFRYVFSDTEFPPGYFASGRVITRFLFPVRVKTTYYDAQYDEVTRAEKPGRYGAVVRIALNGSVVTYRYFTLYRTPHKVYWGDGPGKIPTVELPPDIGIDPVVEHNQQSQIGEAIKNGFFGGGDVSQQIAILLAGLSETSPSDPAVMRTNVFARDTDWWSGLRKHLGLETHYPYLTFLPDGYGSDPGKKWPLIVYLHSDACAGTDLNLLRNFELPGHIKDGLRLPAVVIAPQASLSNYWATSPLGDFLDELLKKYSVDPDRVYLVGSSGGGDMTLTMATLHPERFAAIATVAGEGDFNDVARLKDLPFWAFVGLDDENVIPANVTNLVADINNGGGHAHVTTYPGVGHAAWDKAFSDPAFFQWLLAQKRGLPEVITPGVPSK